MKRPSIGQRAIASAEEALAHFNGETVPKLQVQEPVDVAALRKRMALSQSEFASRFGFSVATLRDWEQRRRVPEMPAQRYLQVIDREPAAVLRALEHLA
jgi:putative transcriptional regulator